MRLPGNYRTNVALPVWGDYNGDSFVDLLVLYGDDREIGSSEQIIWHNNSGTGFENSSINHTINFTSSNEIVSAHWVDFDQDHDLDLILVQGDLYTENSSKFWRNSGTSTDNFLNLDNSVISSCSSKFNVAWNLTAVADMDSDGYLDLVYENGLYHGVILYDPLTGLTPAWNSSRCIANCPRVWDITTFDANLDGIDDVVVSKQSQDHRPMLYLGVHDSIGQFQELHLQQHFSEGGDSHDARGALALDFTQDGLKELFFSQVLEDLDDLEFFFDIPSDAINNHWVGLKLKSPHGLCNRSAIGTTVIVSVDSDVTPHVQARQVDGGSGLASQADLNLSYGLGDIQQPVDVKAILPNKSDNQSGHTIHIRQVPVDQYWVFELDEIDPSSVSGTLVHDLSTETLTLKVTWLSHSNSDPTEDQVSFHFTGIPSAINPGQIVYSGGQAVQPEGNMFRHRLIVPGLPCHDSRRYCINVQRKSGNTFSGSPMISVWTKGCLNVVPGS